MIEIQHLTKYFSTPRGKISVFEDFSLSIEDSVFLGIMGASGSGKSTLLSMIAGLQKPSSGGILIGSEHDTSFPLTDIFSLKDKKLSAFRNAHIGFVSQEQTFLENLSVLDNVRLPFFLSGKKRSLEEVDFISNRAKELLESFGIARLAGSFPRDLSGGENHRLLIARALINNPQIILADEPTESVDKERTEQIVSLFRELAKKGKTVILVSHDEKAVKYCDRVIEIEQKDK